MLLATHNNLELCNLFPFLRWAVCQHFVILTASSTCRIQARHSTDEELSAKEHKALLDLWKVLCVLLAYTLVRIRPQYLFQTSAVWLAVRKTDTLFLDMLLVVLAVFAVFG